MGVKKYSVQDIRAYTDLTDFDEATVLASDYDKLLSAAKTLINKMDLIHKHPEYNAVWSSAFIHRGNYHGPNYQAELQTLRVIVGDSNAS